MNYKAEYEKWKTNIFFDEDIRQELNLLTNNREIEDRFYKELEFGTGGLRGVMGAGTNRINKYTIGKAITGLGNYLLNEYGLEDCKDRGVVIGYDTRNNSKYFAEIAADILSGLGLQIYLFVSAVPTPEISFSVTFLNALAGVVITASHNTKEYNGCKVYDEFGCQLVPKQVDKVIPYINSVADYCALNFNRDPFLIKEVDCTDSFVADVLQQSCYSEEKEKEDLRVIYTPLYGTGNIPVQKTLSEDGFSNVEIVPEQATENGNFPTVISPNPEDKNALELGIDQAKRENADIVLGTDPDCDRVGVAVKVAEDNFVLLSGNQVGALLIDFILNHIDISDKISPAIVKTVVTSDLGAEIARQHGVRVFSTLTGFKFIGEKITEFEQAKKHNDCLRNNTFIFGYEESYGYLAGTYARDKDAVGACLLICEMVAYLKAQGKTLLDHLNELYKQFGYYRDDLETFTLKGKDGIRKINEAMTKLRSEKSFPIETKQVIDYSTPVKAEPGFGFLPRSDVLKFILSDDSWIAVRPSGTEPKIKIYYSMKAEDQEQAESKLCLAKETIHEIISIW